MVSVRSTPALALIFLISESRVAGSPLTARIVSPACRPARSAADPGLTPRICGTIRGSTPMSPISNRVCASGVTVKRLPLAAPLDHDLHLAVRAGHHLDEHLLPGLHARPAMLTMRSPGLDAGALGRASRRARCRRPAAPARRRAPPRPCRARTAITTRPAAMFITGPMIEDLEPLPLGLRHELVGPPAARVVGRLARHLHVAAERDRADAVLRVAADDPEQLGAEAEREGQHADAVAAGHQEMPQLVHEDEHAEDEHETQRRLSSSTAWQPSYTLRLYPAHVLQRKRVRPAVHRPDVGQVRGSPLAAARRARRAPAR